MNEPTGQDIAGGVIEFEEDLIVITDRETRYIVTPAAKPIDFIKAERILHEEIYPSNERIGYKENEVEGGAYVELFSADHMEEDLEGMEVVNPTLLTPEDLQVAINKAFIQTLKFVSKHLDLKKLEHLFPGIDINNIDQYNFRNSRVKVIMLSEEDFDFLDKARFPDSNGSNSAAFTHLSTQQRPSSLVNNDITVNLSQRAVMVINEVPRDVLKKLHKNNATWPRELTEEDDSLILVNVEATVIHELLHQLDIANSLPHMLREGITEWYAQQILRRNYSEDQLKEQIWVGYERAVDTVDVLVESLIKQGIDIETIDRAFIGADSESAERIVEVLIQRYGFDKAKRILDWDFRSLRDGLITVLEFEHDIEKDKKKQLYSYGRE